MITDKPRSADRLREMLAFSQGSARVMYQTEALYHAQIDWTCQLLDAVDEIADQATAALILALIYERLTGDGVSEAAKRQDDARAELARLMRGPVSL